MKYSELKILLKKNGCYKQSEGSKHENWFSPATNKIFQIGRHNSDDVKTGTLNRILKDFGLNLAKVRTSKNITAYELSLRIGKDTSYFYKVESGKINVSFTVLLEICNALEIEPSELFA